jgi:hypothetical protein
MIRMNKDGTLSSQKSEITFPMVLGEFDILAKQNIKYTVVKTKYPSGKIVIKTTFDSSRRNAHTKKSPFQIHIQRAVIAGMTAAAISMTGPHGLVFRPKVTGFALGNEPLISDAQQNVVIADWPRNMAPAVSIPVEVPIQYTKSEVLPEQGGPKMNIHVKIGISLLLLTAVAVLALSFTTNGVFTPFGTIGIVGLCIYGAYVFGSDRGPRKGRS